MSIIIYSYDCSYDGTFCIVNRLMVEVSVISYEHLRYISELSYSGKYFIKRNTNCFLYTYIHIPKMHLIVSPLRAKENAVSMD